MRLVVVVRLAVQGHVRLSQPRLHVAHLAGRHAQVLGHRVDLLVVHPAEPLLGLAQVEEQLALRLGGGHLDDAPVAQHVLVDLGADPVHREGHQPHPDLRVEVLDRLHQADAALLHQVAERQPVAGVAARHVDHEPQVVQHQAARRLDIALVAQAQHQRALLLGAQHRQAVGPLQVLLQTAGRDRQVPGPLHGGVARRCGFVHAPFPPRSGGRFRSPILAPEGASPAARAPSV